MDTNHASSSVGRGNDSHPTVKVGVKLSSSSSKQPSIASKTASALKLRYSSIISTRRGSAAATSKSDSVVETSASTMIAGCRQVTDCVVNIERCGSSGSNTADRGDTAVSCSDEVVTSMPGEQTSGSEEYPEQTESAEDGNTLCPAADTDEETTETASDGENESLSSTTVLDTSQSENHAITEDNIAQESEAVSDDDVTVEGNVVDDVTVGGKVDDDVRVEGNVVAEDDVCNVVTRDCSSLPAPFTDMTVASSTDNTITVASDKTNTDSVKNNDEGIIDQPSADVAQSITSSEVSVSTYIQDPVSEMNAVSQSSVEEHDMESGAELTSDVKECGMATEENSMLNCTVNEDVLGNLPSVYDSRCVSECNLDSASDSFYSVDTTVNRSLSEMECCDTTEPADNVMVAGILSSGTDIDEDNEGTSQRTVSTVSQPCISAATQLQSTDTTTSVSCPTSRFPFLDLLVTQSKLSVDSTPACQSSTAAQSPLTVDSVRLTVAASCDSAVSSHALSPCVTSPDSSLLSYSVAQSSVAQSGMSLQCQLSSVTSHDSIVSESSSVGMTFPDLFKVLC